MNSSDNFFYKLILKHGDNPALIDKDRTYTWKDLLMAFYHDVSPGCTSINTEPVGNKEHSLSPTEKLTVLQSFHLDLFRHGYGIFPLSPASSGYLKVLSTELDIIFPENETLEIRYPDFFYHLNKDLSPEMSAENSPLSAPDTADYLSRLPLKLMLTARPDYGYLSTMFCLIRSGIIYIPVSPKETLSQIKVIANHYGAIIIKDTESFFQKARDKYLKKLNTVEKAGIQTSGKSQVNNLIHTESNPLSGSDEIKDTPAEFMQPANIMLTSGSTGMPKAVVHTIDSHLKSAEGGQSVLTVKSTDRYLLSLPLNHVGGQAIIFKCALTGATAVAPRRDMTLPEQIIKDSITILSLVPTQLVKIIRESSDVLKAGNLRAILLGGAPISCELIRTMQQKYPHITLYGSYGSTEMASQICTAELRDGHPVTAGFPLPHRELIISKDGSGEILVRGKTLALGYLKNNAVISITGDDGYFHTGDIGELTPQGLIITGRKDNMFICGGENMYPEQIETILLQDSRITAAVAVPIPHSKWGYCPVAFVKTAGEYSLDKLKEDALKGNNRIMIPKIWFNWPELPEKGLKINRKLFAEEAVRELTLLKNNVCHSSAGDALKELIKDMHPEQMAVS